MSIGWQDSPNEFIEALLEDGIDINSVSPKGYSPLLECIRWEKFDAAIALLNYGADQNTPNCFPLGVACDKVRQSCDLKIIEHLLQAGASVESILQYFLGELRHPLDEEICSLLLGRQPDLEFADDEGRTGIHLAATDSNRSIEPWIRSGANVNAQTNNGTTALMFSLRNTAKTQLLLESSADVKRTDNAGRNVLHRALETFDPSIEIIQILLTAGADPQTRNNDGMTPILVAASYFRKKAMYSDVFAGSRSLRDEPFGYTFQVSASTAAKQLVDQTMNMAVSNQLIRLITVSGKIGISTHSIE